MKRSLRLVPLFTILFLSSGLALAADAPSADAQVEAQTDAAATLNSSSVSSEAPSESNTVTDNEATHDFLLIQPEWMTRGVEKPSTGAANSYPGYCYNNCRSCYPIGPMNSGCTSAEYPGVYFPCTAEPLC